MGRRCVHEVAQLERRNLQSLGPLPQNPRPAKSHSSLPGRPEPQVAQPSSATGSAPAQPKLVWRCCWGAQGWSAAGVTAGQRGVSGGACPEETLVFSLRREGSAWSLQDSISRWPPNPAAALSSTPPPQHTVRWGLSRNEVNKGIGQVSLPFQQ